METKKILVIHTKPALNDLQGKETLDLELIFGAYEQDVSVLFYHQGVFQALAKQTPEAIGQKDYFATIKALSIYDIDKVYACQLSLEQFGLGENELLPGITALNLSNVEQLKRHADHVYVI